MLAIGPPMLPNPMNAIRIDVSVGQPEFCSGTCAFSTRSLFLSLVDVANEYNYRLISRNSI
ncbi:hypothetical protein MPLA_940011 [Mesorhizobium sp. ORS 3359]|nr:hypothetical protein MPLA_940011 [Mesorhizobium sp. ORS 3359]